MKNNDISSNQDNEILYDFTYLDELSDGDMEFKISMISMFIEAVPVSLNDMRTYYSEKKWKSLREVAHKYKPQLGFMGIKSIKEDVEQIEQNAAAEKNLESIPSLIDKVEEASYIAVKQLKKELDMLM